MILGFDLDLLAAVTTCGTLDDLRAIAQRFCGVYGFAIWVYGLAGPDASLTNYPPHVVEDYKQHRWHYSHDPLISAVGRARRALAWDMHRARPFGQRLDRVEKSVMGQRWDAGARSGVTAQVFDGAGRAFEYGVVSFSRDQPLTAVEQRHVEPHAQLFSAYFHSVAPSILLPKEEKPADVPKLSVRERDCLTWAARGKSSWEIGQLLAISVPTVKFHLTNAARKFGTNGRALTITRAMRAGLINPT